MLDADSVSQTCLRGTGSSSFTFVWLDKARGKRTISSPWWNGVLSIDRLWLKCPKCAEQGKSVIMRPEWNSHIKQWEMRCKLNQTIHVLLLHPPSLTVRSESSDRDVRGS